MGLTDTLDNDDDDDNPDGDDDDLELTRGGDGGAAIYQAMAACVAGGKASGGRTVFLGPYIIRALQKLKYLRGWSSNRSLRLDWRGLRVS
nr:hypothetical protein [Tanacetum cinerariifolium]